MPLEIGLLTVGCFAFFSDVTPGINEGRCFVLTASQAL